MVSRITNPASPRGALTQRGQAILAIGEMSKGKDEINLSTVDAVILCGGLGTRLQRVVGDRPKALAPVQGRPFIDFLLDELIGQGLRRFIMCVGHMKEQITGHLAQRHDAVFQFSQEAKPLGTGGAIHHALPLVTSDPFMVLNGDSICRVDLAGMLRSHRQSGAALTLAAAPKGERHDAGTVQIAPNGQLRAFEEKSSQGDTINAGIYLLNRRSTSDWPAAYPFSLERDVLPNLIGRQPCFAFKTQGEVHDIGTPDRYQSAQNGLP